MQNFFIFHPLCLCMPLLSLCLGQRTYGILPRLSGIVNVVFAFCTIQNILTFLCFSSVFRLSKLFPYSPESKSLKTFNFYNFVITMIPGSKGQKADASLLARGFLHSRNLVSKGSKYLLTPTSCYFKDKTVFALSPFAYSSFTSSPTLYLMISIKSTTDTSKISSDPSSIM